MQRAVYRLEQTLYVIALLAALQFVWKQVIPQVQAAAIVSSYTGAEVDFNDKADTSQWSTSRKVAYVESVSAKEPLGVMTIGPIGLEAPIYAGTTNAVLDRGVGWLEGTGDLSGQGNVVLAGHRDGFFRPLKDVAVGHLIELNTATGRHRYRVTDTEIVAPDAVRVLRKTRSSQLTLITCFPFYFVGSAPQRFIVHALAE